LIPEDGGTPRRPIASCRWGHERFSIRAAFEDGGQSALRHAHIRVDLLCRNSTPQPVWSPCTLICRATVTHRLRQQAGGGHEARDFVFIQPPGGEWRQVNGTTEGWVATVRFELRQARPESASVPWYTYATTGDL
jgi:hypothetical protein